MGESSERYNMEYKVGFKVIYIILIKVNKGLYNFGTVMEKLVYVT